MKRREILGGEASEGEGVAGVADDLEELGVEVAEAVGD